MYHRFFGKVKTAMNRTELASGIAWTCAAAMAGALAFYYVQAESIVDDVHTLPPSTATDSKLAKIELKLESTTSESEFTVENALYFATMSKIAYLPKAAAEDALVGNDTSTGMGFTQFHWFEVDAERAKAAYFDKIHDTEGYVAANDEVIFVAFRGTKEAIDWATNINLISRRVPAAWGIGLEIDAEVHEGFDDGLNTVWLSKGMLGVISKLYHEEGKNRKLYLTGHSLGGALATIAAAHLVFVENMHVSGILSIGSPRVFDSGMAKIFNEKINYGVAMKDKYFRCRNNNDIVTRVPFGYAHVGTEIYFDRFGTLSTTSFLDRFLGRVNALVHGNVLKGISDHSSNEYLRLLKQAVIHNRVPLLDKTKGIAIDVARKVLPGVKQKGQTHKGTLGAAKAAAVNASQEL